MAVRAFRFEGGEEPYGIILGMPTPKFGPEGFREPSMFRGRRSIGPDAVRRNRALPCREPAARGDAALHLPAGVSPGRGMR